MARRWRGSIGGLALLALLAACGRIGDASDGAADQPVRLRFEDRPEPDVFSREGPAARDAPKGSAGLAIRSSSAPWLPLVLLALLAEARTRSVVISYPRRVQSIERGDDGFTVGGDWGAVFATRVVIATGGMSIPKSGSDGFGLSLARAFGHTTTAPMTPGLVPLTLPRNHFLCALSGVTLPASLELRSATGKRLVVFTDSTLLTHFGMSGPSVLDISRYYLHAQHADARATLFVNWLPETSAEALDGSLQKLESGVLAYLRSRLPERLRALCANTPAWTPAPAATN